MKNLLVIFSILYALTNYAQTKSIQFSPPLTKTSPANAGMSTERLERISEMLDEAVKSGEIPGAVALVSRHA